MIGIIGAMQVEIDGLRAQMTEKSAETFSGVEYVRGILDGTEIVTAVCGVGKVFAAICTQTMILKYGVQSVINTGIGGTLTDRLGILDVAVSTGVVEHDMDTSAVGDPVGMISGINRIELPADERLAKTAQEEAAALSIHTAAGVIASGDQFVADRARKDWIRTQFGAIACEMEGAAVGHVCFVNQVPFVIIRAISDTATGGGVDDYFTFKQQAAELSLKLTRAMVRRLG